VVALRISSGRGRRAGARSPVVRPRWPGTAGGSPTISEVGASELLTVAGEKTGSPLPVCGVGCDREVLRGKRVEVVVGIAIRADVGLDDGDVRMGDVASASARGACPGVRGRRCWPFT
jgi:hypothetical protein